MSKKSFLFLDNFEIHRLSSSLPALKNSSGSKENKFGCKSVAAAKIGTKLLELGLITYLKRCLSSFAISEGRD
jgi:hypothetical protein